MKVTNLLLHSARLWYHKDVKLYSAAFSYYAPMALIPLIVLSITIIGLIYGTDFVKEFFLSWGVIFGTDLSTLISIAVNNLNAETKTFQVPILGIFLFSGISIFALNVLSAGFNHLWDTNYDGVKNWLHKSIRSIIFILVLQLYFIFIIGFEFFLTITKIEFTTLISTVFIFINTTILFVVLYKFLPIKSPSFKGCVFGGLIAAILFMAAKILVGLYLASSSSINLYGAAGIILVLLVWVYILAALIYYGAAVAHIYDRMYQNK